jgi:hypothetical protein
VWAQIPPTQGAPSQQRSVEEQLSSPQVGLVQRPPTHVVCVHEMVHEPQ